MLNVVMLSVTNKPIMLSVVMLSIIFLNVVILSVTNKHIMSGVIRLSVVVPDRGTETKLVFK
jgi:hypothetical protein